MVLGKFELITPLNRIINSNCLLNEGITELLPEMNSNDAGNLNEPVGIVILRG
jgi:hypothetical protein